MARHLFRREKGKNEWIDTGSIDQKLLDLGGDVPPIVKEARVIAALLKRHDNTVEFEVREVPDNTERSPA